MERRKFVKQLGKAGIAGTFLAAQSQVNDSRAEALGFEHLPINERTTMNTVLHKSNSRGTADHGWLKSKHTFSFASYHNPERMNFGVLRVLNDDQVIGGAGFSKHPHNNMEIVSIPLAGNLKHKDSMNNVAVIRSGDIQIMSAGTGVEHSEKNDSSTEDVQFLQIWIFPKQRDLKPNYDQIPLSDLKVDNALYQVLSPNADDAGVMINQDAWFHMGEFDKSNSFQYHLKKPNNGVYTFVLEGNAHVNGQLLEQRDGYGVWNTSELKYTVEKGTRLLVMEVPMEID